ncbi:hypothetical protein [Methyloversatilis thermotolerans]|uniref:hypothetical protein n=1 Tax=Methyloversatilis thermotolerans TaxID=1346290 RepID=UPI0012FB1C8E|nr:hypothetical protein [Methyloversatilis thermotolerans]
MSERLKDARINIAELPEAQYRDFIENEQRRIDANAFHLEQQYTERVDPPVDSPLTRPYATIVVGGKVVATIDNQGVITTDDALSDALKNRLAAADTGKGGPLQAETNAAILAAHFGGRIRPASTAITQAKYEELVATPAATPRVDTNAMQKDPLHAQIERWSAGLEDIMRQREYFLGTRSPSGAPPAS